MPAIHLGPACIQLGTNSWTFFSQAPKSLSRSSRVRSISMKRPWKCVAIFGGSIPRCAKTPGISRHKLRTTRSIPVFFPEPNVCETSIVKRGSVIHTFYPNRKYRRKSALPGLPSFALTQDASKTKKPCGDYLRFCASLRICAWASFNLSGH